MKKQNDRVICDICGKVGLGLRITQRRNAATLGLSRATPMRNGALWPC